MMTIEIRINGAQIDLVEVVRVAGLEHELCQYKVKTVYSKKDKIPVPGLIDHHYDDGALVLCQIALKAVDDARANRIMSDSEGDEE